MPQNFGDTFVQSLQFGTKIAQEADQHAQAVAMKEKELAANQALEGLKMDALNRQVDIAKQEELDRAKYQYDSNLKEKTQLFSQSMLGIDPRNKYVRQLNLPVYNAEQASKQFGVPVTPGTFYTDAQWGPAIVGAEQLDRQISASASADAKRLAPLTEADTLNADFDKQALPEMTTKKTIPAFPGTLQGIGQGLENIDLTPGKNGMWKGSIANMFVEGFTKQTGTQTIEEPNYPSIRDYLNKQADIVGKMIPRAKGESFPLYGSSIGAYTNIAESLLKVDENGNASFDSQGLNPTAAKVALYSIASSHKTGFLNAMAEAEAARKATTVTDKSKAEEEYQIAINNAKKQYPLYKEAIGQAFGQRYTRQ